MLPLVPADRLAATPIVDVKYDAGETVGWERFAATVAAVRGGIPPGELLAVLASHYGEAGAVDRYLPELGPAHSGQNSYWTWGPPPDDATSRASRSSWPARGCSPGRCCGHSCAASAEGQVRRAQDHGGTLAGGPMSGPTRREDLTLAGDRDGHRGRPERGRGPVELLVGPGGVVVEQHQLARPSDR